MATIDQKSGVFAGLVSDNIPPAGKLVSGKPKNFVAMQFGDATPPGPLDNIKEMLDFWYAMDAISPLTWVDNSYAPDVFADSQFTAPNGTGITAYTPDTGNAWTLFSGVESTIQNNELESAGAGRAMQDCGNINFTITADVTVEAAGLGNSIEIGFRSTGDTLNESFYFSINDGFATAYEVDNLGASSEISLRWVTNHLNVTRKLRIDCYESGISIYLDETKISEGKFDYYFENDHTFNYISFDGSTGRVDNFKVTTSKLDIRSFDAGGTTTPGVGSTNISMFADSLDTRLESPSPGNPLVIHERGDGDWTVQIWGNPTNLTSGNGYKALMGCGQLNGGWYLIIRDEEPQLHFLGGVKQSLFTGKATLLNTWYHFVITYNDTTKIVTLYRNAEVIGTLDFTATSHPYAANTVEPWYLNIGFWYPSNPLYFDGRIDEVARWHRLLTLEEIIALYDNGDGKTFVDLP